MNLDLLNYSDILITFITVISAFLIARYSYIKDRERDKILWNENISRDILYIYISLGDLSRELQSVQKLHNVLKDKLLGIKFYEVEYMRFHSLHTNRFKEIGYTRIYEVLTHYKIDGTTLNGLFRILDAVDMFAQSLDEQRLELYEKREYFLKENILIIEKFLNDLNRQARTISNYYLIEGNVKGKFIFDKLVGKMLTSNNLDLIFKYPNIWRNPNLKLVNPKYADEFNNFRFNYYEIEQAFFKFKYFHKKKSEFLVRFSCSELTKLVTRITAIKTEIQKVDTDIFGVIK